VPLLYGLGLLAAFVVHERRATSPLLRLRILRLRSLRAASFGAAVNAVAFTAIVYVGTLYLQLALDYSPLQAGLALLPLDAVAFVIPLAGAHAIARRTPRSSPPSRSPHWLCSGSPAHPSRPTTCATSSPR
jgi:hypothetical protein